MARYHMTENGPVPFSDEEEAEWDARETDPHNSVETRAWADIRIDRNNRLSASDWTQLSDAHSDKIAWATYRQALRDITTQADPFNIVWPTAPDASPIAK